MDSSRERARRRLVARERLCLEVDRGRGPLGHNRVRRQAEARVVPRKRGGVRRWAKDTAALGAPA